MQPKKLHQIELTLIMQLSYLQVAFWVNIISRLSILLYNLRYRLLLL